MSTGTRPVAPTVRGDELLIGGARLDQLRTAVQTTHAGQFRRLHEQCEWYAGQTLPTEHPTASVTYLGFAAANLALAWKLTGQPAYLHEARRWIATAVGFPHWGKAHMPDHDLDAGWLCHGLALAYDWLRDDLPAEEAEQLRAKLVLQGGRLYDFAIASVGGWWRSSYWQNHNWICFAGLATAGYALRGEHPPAAGWTALARDNFDEVLALLPEDGSDAEGVVYWRYGVPWLAIYLDVLESAEGIDLFPASDFLRNTFWYRLYQAAPGLEEIVNHGDCHDRRSGHSVALYYKLAAKYRIPAAQWLAEHVAQRLFWREAYESGVRPGIMPEAFLELLWYDPEQPAEPIDGLPLARFFPDLGLLSARTGWDPTATLLSFKASPGGGHKAWATSHAHRRDRGWDTLNAGHHHPDANSFVMLSGGAFLAVDDGYANRKRAAGHNLVLVDGRGFVNEDRYHVYKDLPERHTAQVSRVVTGHGWAAALGESAAMYPPELGVRQVDRHLVFTPSGRLVLLDELAATEPRTWQWLLHSDHPPEQLDEDRWLVRKGGGRLLVASLGPGDAKPEQTETVIHANPTSSTPSLAIERRLQTLRLGTPATEQTTFLTALVPGRALGDDAPEVSQLSGTGTGVRVDDGASLELVAFGEQGRIALPGLRADAELVALLVDADGSISLLVATARRVELDGRALLEAAEPVAGTVTWAGDGAAGPNLDGPADLGSPRRLPYGGLRGGG